MWYFEDSSSEVTKGEFYLNSCASLASSDRICLVGRQKRNSGSREGSSQEAPQRTLRCPGHCIIVVWLVWLQPRYENGNMIFLGAGGRGVMWVNLVQGHWISSHHSFKSEMALLCCESASGGGI